MKKGRPISLIMIIFSLALFCSYHIYYYVLGEVNNQKVDKILEKEVLLKNSSKEIVVNKDSNDEILGVIEIPKIGLRQAFYNIDSKKNNVNQNIEILKASKMPNEKNSTMFLAAHSGNSYLGYFKNLNKLKLDEEIYIYYQSRKYIYVVSSVYETEKNGRISIIKNSNEKILVLTTCHGKNKQLVVMAKLLKEVDSL